MKTYNFPILCRYKEKLTIRYNLVYSFKSFKLNIILYMKYFVDIA